MMAVASVGEIPVDCLTGELAGIWSGWRSLGDREVVREASAKGTHISLAQKCLACRRHCSLGEAQKYFDKEVDVWVNELLNKQQVHKASHILQNVGKNPNEYISIVCIKCKEPKLRGYLVQHLAKVNGLEQEHTEAWNIINSVIKYETKYTLKDGLISNKSIEEIMQVPENVKNTLCTELYFHIFEPQISEKLQPTVIWNYLLSNNRIDLLRFWIDMNYASNKAEIDFADRDIVDKTGKVFTDLKITEEMIELVEECDATAITKQLTLNHLCRYGIFTKKEQISLKLTLARLFNNKIVPSEFDKILSHKSCNMDKCNFMLKLDIRLYSKNYLEENTIQEADARNKNLADALYYMCNAQNAHCDALERGILDTIHYVSEDSIEFLKQNHLITSALIFLHYGKKVGTLIRNADDMTIEKKSLKEIFTDKSGLNIGKITVTEEVIRKMLTRLPYLRNAIENNSNINDITMYQLLNGYKNFNASQAFKWRQKSGVMPTFSSENLIKKYGHKKKLSYMNYLKEMRPNMAVSILQQQQNKSHGYISSKMKFQACLDAHIFGLRNLNRSDIISSCISFIEILGVDSENFRLHVTIADYVQKELNVSIGNLLESIMYENQRDLTSLWSYLDRSFYTRLTTDLIDNVPEFISTLKMWDIIVRFARAQNVSLPTILLTFLAKHNFWFEFVLVGHVFAYPIDQILEQAKHFENVNVQEHLLVSLNNSQLLRPNSAFRATQKFKSRDSRQFLYSKLGFKQNESPNSSPPSAPTDTSSSTESCTSTSENLFSYYNTHLSGNDLWMTILRCHQSQDPPGALLNASRLNMSPVLTVLAACYEPSSAAAYWCSWLVMSIGSEEFIFEYEESLEQQMWSAGKVLQLIENVTSLGYVHSLSRSLQIFMPENPLCPLAEFLVQCINLGEFEMCQKHLLNFKSRCSSLKCNKMINWDCTDISYLENVYWIATVAIKCIIIALGKSLRSRNLQIKFLDALTKCDFDVDLPVDSPNLHCLLEFVQILSKSNVTLNFLAFEMTENECNTDKEIERCINELMRDENYSCALELSEAAHINCSEVILAQYRSEFKQSIDKDGTVESGFWKRCAVDFKKYKVYYEQAAEFFVEHVEKLVSHKERYVVLKLALEILKESATDQKIIDTVEMAMWKSCILAGPENVEIECEEGVFNKLKTELLSGLNNLQVSCKLTEPFEKSAVETLINRLLDAGKLDIALRISAIFNYKHRDLQVLMLCLSLAEGEISPYQLTVQQRMLLSTGNQTKQQKHSIFRSRGLQRWSSSSSLSSYSVNLNQSGNSKTIEVATTVIDDEQIRIDCILLLGRLLETLRHGLNTGKRVALCYRLTTHLGKSYQALLTLSDPIKFLREIVENNYERKLEIISDIVTAYCIKNHEVAEFLAEKIVTNITLLVEDEADRLMAIWGYPLDVNFHLIIELCNEPSLLGSKLLEIANSLLGRSYGEKRNVSTLKIIVELLIRAHDCFTASCNMEGIALILRKCQHLTNSLQNLKQWSLLVRLVTGVGRFTEMNYIFQILKEHDQFEFLLGRGLDKVPGLKMALLEFLKRQCPENKDLFNLVALHFRLYHEIALMWESEAKEAMNRLIVEAKGDCRNTLHASQVDVKFIRNESTEKTLHLAITNFTHATQYYLQDNKLNLAYRSSHQAQLVALQVSLIGAVAQNQQVACILNLTSSEIDRIICQVLSFPQSLILVRAYNHHADWTSAIYARCILNGESRYLKEFMTSYVLSSAIVRDCAKRYQLEKSITKQMAENMQMVLSHLTDIECKYMLASQLGFKKIIESMLGNAMISSYLKDTVWRKGYSNPEFI